MSFLKTAIGNFVEKITGFGNFFEKRKVFGHFLTFTWQFTLRSGPKISSLYQGCQTGPPLNQTGKICHFLELFPVHIGSTNNNLRKTFKSPNVLQVPIWIKFDTNILYLLYMFTSTGSVSWSALLFSICIFKYTRKHAEQRSKKIPRYLNGADVGGFLNNWVDTIHFGLAGVPGSQTE